MILLWKGTHAHSKVGVNDFCTAQEKRKEKLTQSQNQSSTVDDTRDRQWKCFIFSWTPFGKVCVAIYWILLHGHCKIYSHKAKISKPPYFLSSLNHCTLLYSSDCLNSLIRAAQVPCKVSGYPHCSPLELHTTTPEAVLIFDIYPSYFTYFRAMQAYYTLFSVKFKAGRNTQIQYS